MAINPQIIRLIIACVSLAIVGTGIYLQWEIECEVKKGTSRIPVTIHEDRLLGRIIIISIVTMSIIVMLLIINLSTISMLWSILLIMLQALILLPLLVFNLYDI